MASTWTKARQPIPVALDGHGLHDRLGSGSKRNRSIDPLCLGRLFPWALYVPGEDALPPASPARRSKTANSRASALAQPAAPEVSGLVRAGPLPKAPSLFIEPQAGRAPILQAINSARSEIRLGICNISDPEIGNALGAAVARGVNVEVIVDQADYQAKPPEQAEVAQLLADHVSVHLSNSVFPQSFEKELVIDQRQIVIMTMCLIPQTFEDTRDYGLILANPARSSRKSLRFSTTTGPTPPRRVNRPAALQPDSRLARSQPDLGPDRCDSQALPVDPVHPSHDRRHDRAARRSLPGRPVDRSGAPRRSGPPDLVSGRHARSDLQRPADRSTHQPGRQRPRDARPIPTAERPPVHACQDDDRRRPRGLPRIDRPRNHRGDPGPRTRHYFSASGPSLSSLSSCLPSFSPD